MGRWTVGRDCSFSHMLKDCRIMLEEFKMLSSCQLRHGGTADANVHSQAVQQSQSPRQTGDSSVLFCKVSFPPVYIPELFNAVSAIPEA